MSLTVRLTENTPRSMVIPPLLRVLVPGNAKTSSLVAQSPIGLTFGIQAGESCEVERDWIFTQSRKKTFEDGNCQSAATLAASFPTRLCAQKPVPIATIPKIALTRSVKWHSR